MLDRLRGLRRNKPVRPRGPLAPIARADQAALAFLRTRGHAPGVEAAMKALGTAGEYAAVWTAIGGAAALADPSRRGRWLAAAATGPASIVVNFAIKVGIGRERPLLEEHPRLGRAPTELSFPSAHATSSVAAAIALGRVEPRARIPLLALAAAICVGRPYLGMHYPSDVLAGIALGTAIGSLVPGLGGPEDEDRLLDLAITGIPAGAGGGAAERAPAGAGDPAGA